MEFQPRPSYYNKLLECLSLTGHWTVGTHGSMLDLDPRYYCRSYKNEEEVETVSHLLRECAALMRISFLLPFQLYLNQENCQILVFQNLKTL